MRYRRSSCLLRHSATLARERLWRGADFATAPGLGIAYEIGKMQIEQMLAERRLERGDKFTLRGFTITYGVTATYRCRCNDGNCWV